MFFHKMWLQGSYLVSFRMEMLVAIPVTERSPFCVCHLLLGMRLVLECGWYIQWHAIGENEFSPFQQVLIAISSLSRGGTLYLLPLLSWGIFWFWIYVGLVCAVIVSLSSHVCQSYCVWKVLFLWGLPSLLILTSQSFSTLILTHERGYCNKDFSGRTECSKVSHFSTCGRGR